MYTENKTCYGANLYDNKALRDFYNVTGTLSLSDSEVDDAISSMERLIRKSESLKKDPFDENVLVMMEEIATSFIEKSEKLSKRRDVIGTIPAKHFKIVYEVYDPKQHRKVEKEVIVKAFSAQGVKTTTVYQNLLKNKKVKIKNYYFVPKN